MKTALYRHYDAAGQLLYVGITNHALRRLAEHGGRAEWFRQIAKITVAWLPGREQAMQAEREAIRRERPKYNVRLVEPLSVPVRVAWGVFHPASQRFDGWYFDEEDARAMVAFFRSEFPQDAFCLVSRTQDQPPRTGRVPLRTLNADEWSSTALTTVLTATAKETA